MRIIELLKNSTAQFNQNYFHFHIGAIYNKQSTSTGELNLSKSSYEKYISEVGFEPMPTRVDCDLNAAP